ncbi:c-type cytochrome [Paracnuella aquatica]|uniref:c-type cytochrome n=1 Tax=Paracnuella aquatica TaxID=2268757 RepID=UPI000DF01A28|nr:cytochrome c [Paracnuella aquatica]RPD47288.1 cytochrome c [Paracnuella aquatica]
MYLRKNLPQQLATGRLLPLCLLVLLAVGCAQKKDDAQPLANKQLPSRFGFGRPATAAQIAAVDIDVRPDGQGLPPGSGTVPEGRAIYATKCASCHGATGVEGPYNRLVSSDTSRAKAIGNYWPYATTLFDYIRRAMPFNAPGSLSNDEVYHLTAYLLHANGLVAADIEMNAANLPKVVMPAEDLFFPDDRTGGAEIR